MFCSGCGTQLPDSASFCLNCGKPLQLETLSRPVITEVCKIEECEAAQKFFGGIHFRRNDRLVGWWEAIVADQIIARSPEYHYKNGRYIWQHDSEGSKAIRNTKQALIDQLSADGWEPIIDPQSGDVNAMKRAKRS